MIYCCY